MTRKVDVACKIDTETVDRLTDLALRREHLCRSSGRMNLSRALKTALHVGLRELEDRDRVRR